MPLDVKITDLPATFSINPSDLFVVVDLSGLPTTKKINAATLAALSPVQSVAGKTGTVNLEIADIADLQTTLNQKQAAGNYVKLVWSAQSISGTVNDYSTSGANMIVVLATYSARITGFSGGSSSAWLRIINSNSTPLTIAHQSADSVVENRIIIASGADYTMGENEEVGFFYDPISLRWRMTTGCVAPY
jgi:hypothetical protein